LNFWQLEIESSKSKGPPLRAQSWLSVPVNRTAECYEPIYHCIMKLMLAISLVIAVAAMASCHTLPPSGHALCSLLVLRGSNVVDSTGPTPNPAPGHALPPSGHTLPPRNSLLAWRGGNIMGSTGPTPNPAPQAAAAPTADSAPALKPLLASFFNPRFVEYYFRRILHSTPTPIPHSFKIIKTR
jgi:hypothetical protein